MAACFRLDTAKFANPILVSSADGVGTKLKVAFALGMHHTVGADLVNHCVNDIAVQGATPLFFLDYLAIGQLDDDVAQNVVSGVAEACRANGCALIGGETAQMPGFYADGEYDLAGFIVGAVDKEKLITGSNIQAGDVLIGFPSTGLHTNGYSLARKLFFEVAGYAPNQYVNELKDKAGAALMKVHRSYLAVIKKLTAADLVVGMAHITGGGITENLPRILPKTISAVVETGVMDPVSDLYPPAAARQRGAGRDVAHLQHGRRPDCRGAGGQVQARQVDARSRRGKILRHRPYRQGRP